MATDESKRLREQLTTELERRGLIRSGQVREAFLVVPREHFVPALAAGRAWRPRTGTRRS